MQVKVGDRYYDSEEEPIMVILTEKEKNDVVSMVGTKYTKMCKAPAEYGDAEFKQFMDMTPEEEARFTEKIR